MGQGQGKLASGTPPPQQQGPPPCAAGAEMRQSGASSSSSPACPVVGGEGGASTSTSGAVYNVYNQRIDVQNASEAQRQRTAEEKNFRSIWSLGWVWGGGGGGGSATGINAKNNMPLEANQQPSAGQRKPLSTARESSTIPKGGTEASTWQYPSPQMFFNALNRKGKADGVEEDDMSQVVFFHNGMNEVTWNEVKRWELLHAGECKQGDGCEGPKLTRFRGRPHDLSPLARIRSWTSGDVPFDRHDWYVDRCGEEVRYVIDFYFDEEKAGQMEAFEVVARPALDSFTSCLDRLKMNIYVTCAEYGLPCPISGHEPKIASAPSDANETSTTK